uniref:Uncharacterized protein n=1 Tax=Stegastes partitus TaxID=144197 RepID=A0A3B5A8U8_9TELE
HTGAVERTYIYIYIYIYTHPHTWLTHNMSVLGSQLVSAAPKWAITTCCTLLRFCITKVLTSRIGTIVDNYFILSVTIEHFLSLYKALFIWYF